MSYEILDRPHPNIVCLRVYDSMEVDDMLIDDELGLNDDKPMWLVIDASDVGMELPSDFLNTAAHSFYVHHNLQFVSLYLTNRVLENIARMVNKITRRNHFQVFSSYAAALADAHARVTAAGL